MATSIDYQCLTGFKVDEMAPDCEESEANSEECPGLVEYQQSPEFQRECYCKSQYLDSMRGCHACYLEHGVSESLSPWSFNFTMVPSIMSEYCDSAATPTADFSYYLSSASPTFNKADYNEKHTAVTFFDPMGDATDVSLYYTPSLTGSAAWHTTLSTIEGWAENAIRTTRATAAGKTSSPTQSATDSVDSSEADATTADTTSPPTQSATDSSEADAMHSGGNKNGVLGIPEAVSLVLMIAML